MWDLCRWWSAFACATLTATIVGGCDDGGVDVDPEIELGFRADGVFRPLVDGSGLPVINGPQGGFWTMPTLRTTGFEPKLVVQAALDDLVSEQPLVAEEDERMFNRGEDGWSDELLYLPLPSLRTIEDLAALDGHDAHLELVVSDTAESLRFEANVVIEAVLP